MRPWKAIAYTSISSFPTITFARALLVRIHSVSYTHLDVYKRQQILNARSFERQGYSIVLEEEELNKEVLLQSILRLYENRDSYISAMKNSPQQNSIDTIIDLIEAVSKK